MVVAAGRPSGRSLRVCGVLRVANVGDDRRTVRDYMATRIGGCIEKSRHLFTISRVGGENVRYGCCPRSPNEARDINLYHCHGCARKVYVGGEVG